MKEIPLTKGAIAIVDDADFEAMSRIKWHLSSTGYATSKPRGGRVTYMHRLILCPPDSLVVDHINREKLDNRRENLRAVPNWLNLQNRGKQRNNTTGFKGVFKCKKPNRWYAIKRIRGKPIYLGVFDSPEAASKAYEAIRI